MQLYKIMINHEVIETHEQIAFDLKDESDGTIRLIDLIPALADLCEHERIYVIDELDRSMHAQLTRAFLEHFFRVPHREVSYWPLLMKLTFLIWTCFARMRYGLSRKIGHLHPISIRLKNSNQDTIKISVEDTFRAVLVGSQ